MSYPAAGPAPAQDGDSSNDQLVISDDPRHPANLICELCRKFYQWGWVGPPHLAIAVSSRAKSHVVHDPLTSAGDGHRRRDEHPARVWEPSSHLTEPDPTNGPYGPA